MASGKTFLLLTEGKLAKVGSERKLLAVSSVAAIRKVASPVADLARPSYEVKTKSSRFCGLVLYSSGGSTTSKPRAVISRECGPVVLPTGEAEPLL